MITKIDGNAQFCSYMNRHFFCHTSCSIDYPYSKGLLYHPEMFCNHNPSRATAGRIAMERYQGSTGARRLVRHGQSLCHEIFIQVWECIIVSENEWLQLFPWWNHIQLKHVKIGNTYDGLLTKENLWPMFHACINNSQNNVYLFWLYLIIFYNRTL